VANINPGTRDGNPTALTAVGGGLFFAADDGTHGTELWHTDGTQAGTALVRDIDPGTDGDYYSGPSPLAAVGQTLYFSADDGTHGRELWKSDGTEAGTVLVKDINLDAYDSDPGSPAVVGDTLFFSARDGVHGSELWTSDGTEGGTVLVKDISSPETPYGPTSLTEAGGTLFFAADDGVHGQELWTSDGTAAGTALVDDINTGGAFDVSSRGTPDTARGTLRLPVYVDTAGTFEVSPAGRSPIRTTSRDVPGAERITVTLTPTRAGMRQLRKDGSLEVRARFTFTTCGGTVTTAVHRYTLRLK